MITCCGCCLGTSVRGTSVGVTSGEQLPGGTVAFVATVAMGGLTPPPRTNEMDPRKAMGINKAQRAFNNCKVETLKVVSALDAARGVLDAGYSPVVNQAAFHQTMQRFAGQALGTPCDVHALVHFFVEKQAGLASVDPQTRRGVSDDSGRLFQVLPSESRVLPPSMEESEPPSESMALVSRPNGHSALEGAGLFGERLAQDAQVAVAQIGIELSQRITAPFQQLQGFSLWGGA